MRERENMTAGGKVFVLYLCSSVIAVVYIISFKAKGSNCMCK